MLVPLTAPLAESEDRVSPLADALKAPIMPPTLLAPDTVSAAALLLRFNVPSTLPIRPPVFCCPATVPVAAMADTAFVPLASPINAPVLLPPVTFASSSEIPLSVAPLTAPKSPVPVERLARLIVRSRIARPCPARTPLKPVAVMAPIGAKPAPAFQLAVPEASISLART